MCDNPPELLDGRTLNQAGFSPLGQQHAALGGVFRTLGRREDELTEALGFPILNTADA